MKRTAESLVEGISAVSQWMSEHYAITNLFLIPFFALAFLIAFKKFKLNYPEWLVVSSFITGQHMVLYIFSGCSWKESSQFQRIVRYRFHRFDDLDYAAIFL